MEFLSQGPKSKQKYARLFDLLKEQQDAGVAALGALERAAEYRSEHGRAVFRRGITSQTSSRLLNGSAHGELLSVCNIFADRVRFNANDFGSGSAVQTQ